jgi:type IV secretion system protein VirB6
MMACQAITTGNEFLAATLTHIDCQAQTLGSFGFAALAAPGSPTSLALTSLLTVFIALFGVRLLLGYPVAGRDVINDIIKVGIVLTLATSWPAWRVLGYDLVIAGPSEIARSIGLGAGLQGASGDLANRLQQVDNGLAMLNVVGSGRLGVAQGDWFQLGFARIVYLAGTLAPLALVRLTAGVLLAIAPLMAALLLFGVTRSIFIGWARGLVMTFLASLTLTLLLGAELSIIEPWMSDALVKRGAEQQILDAPIEILAVTLAFTVACLGTLFLIAKVAFHSEPLAWASRSTSGIRSPVTANPVGISRGAPVDETPSRATAVALSVSESLRREDRMNVTRSVGGTRMGAENSASGQPSPRTDAAGTLGASYRRGARRVSATGMKRDQTR